MFTDTRRIGGVLTGDESDGEIYVGTTPKPIEKARNADALWKAYPEVTVYNGGKTNKNVGAFAGVVDVQGMDVYAAACAPYLTRDFPTLAAVRDYLANARVNHAPGATWFYAQGLHSGWNRTFQSNMVSVQPDPQELLTQAMLVMSTGGKGLMWFQFDADEIAYRPDRYTAMATANFLHRAVRALIREGEPTGLYETDDTTITEVIRTPDALVIPIINNKVATAVTARDCFAALLQPESGNPHLTFADATPTIRVEVPDDLALADIFEVDGAARDVVTPTMGVSRSDRTISLTDIPLSNDTPVRLVVLAKNPDLREKVRAWVKADVK